MHSIVLFYDQIVITFFFEPTKEQVRKIKIIENNKKKLKYSKHKKEDKVSLMKMFDKDKEEVLKGAKEEYLSEINKLLASKITKDFKDFSTDKKQKRSRQKSINKGSLKVNYIGDSKDFNSLDYDCKNYYIGLGLRLSGKKIWHVDKVSEDSVAHDIGLKKGDVLLGFKTKDGTFYEGNRLIPKLQKKGSDLSVILVYKQEGILKEKNITLDKVCYTKKSSKLLK